MVKYKKMPTDVSVAIRYKHQDGGETPAQLARQFEFPLRSIRWHCKKPIPQIDQKVLDKIKRNPRIEPFNRPLCMMAHGKYSTVLWVYHREAFSHSDFRVTSFLSHNTSTFIHWLGSLRNQRTI